MPDEPWYDVDGLLAELLIGADPALDEALRANASAGLPAIDVSPPQGKLLQILVELRGARSVLELGALGGYSTIWLARGLPSDGKLISLELNADYAEVARANVARSGLGDRVEFRVGPALESLRRLADEDGGPFDLIFIDADKRTTPQYFSWALELSRPGTLIVTDNVVRRGSVIDPDNDPDARGMRTFIEQLANEPRVLGTVIQTVGSKGYDGFAIALVRDAVEH